MRSLLALAVSCALLPCSGPVAAAGFVGPVFGITTAPNGDILAADAAAGISQFKGGNVTLEAAMGGANDVSAIGRGAWWVVTGASGEGGQMSDTGQGVYRVSRGKVRKLANLYDFEVLNNPAPDPPGTVPESNPFDVQALGGEYALVADAAGNDLLWVDDEGHVGVVAVFPYEPVSSAHLKQLLNCQPGAAGLCALPDPFPAQPVPTSIAVGPDGYWYVGELKGIPAPVNESRIWRIAPGASGAHCPDADCELLFDGGFTSIIDLAFGPDGLLYVVELDENSWFATNLPPQALAGGTINACDVDTLDCTVVAHPMALPTAITFGKNGTLWSTVMGPVPGGAATIVKVP